MGRFGFSFALLAALLASMPSALAAAPPIAAYYDGRMPVSKIPADKLTDVIYAFAEPNDNLLCRKPTVKQKKAFAELRHLRKSHPHLRLLVSIGGWNAAPQFSDIALSKASRTAFARSCIKRYIVQQGFDGIDLDWEFPVHGGTNQSRPADRAHATKLVDAFRRQLDELGDLHTRHFLLTIATPAGRWQKGGAYAVTDSYNLAAIEPNVDWFNVMTYDMNNIFSPVSGFNTPLKANPDDPTPKSARKWDNLEAAVAFYQAHGVPADKIMLGFAFYGRGFTGVSSADGGLYSSYQGGYPELAWRKIHTRLLTNPAWVRHWSRTAQAPWLYNAKKHIFFTYDDPLSMAIKADYARRQHLRGAMIWVLGEDDAQHSLLRALASHLAPCPEHKADRR
jgi:chitinase